MVASLVEECRLDVPGAQELQLQGSGAQVQ